MCFSLVLRRLVLNHCRNKLTESEAMATAITRHAALKSRTALSSSQDSAASILELAKMDVVKQRQKAQVVLRNPSLSKIKCVKPVKPRGSSLHSTMNGVKRSSNLPVNSGPPQPKSFLQTNGGRLKLVTPRLPWNVVKVASRTDSGLCRKSMQRNSTVLLKEPCPRPRKPSNLTPADRDDNVNLSSPNLSSNLTANVNVVMRKPKHKSANAEQTSVKRTSRSLESLMNGVCTDSYLAPTQCFKCRKDMVRVLDSSASSRFSDTYSSASDLNCSFQDLQFDENNNNLAADSVAMGVINQKRVNSRHEVLKAEKLVTHPPPVDIVSDTECYRYHVESDSQAENDYGIAIASDTEVYRYKAKLKDKRHLHLDSPIPHLLREQRTESTGSIKERKIQIEQDLNSLLDSMAYALGNYEPKTKCNSTSDKNVDSSDGSYSPPAFFRPIFEVKI